MATPSKKDKRKPLDNFCPLEAKSNRVAAMLLPLGFEGRAHNGTIIVPWGTNEVTFGLTDTLAGLGHDQQLSVTLWGHLLENVAPTRQQIEKAVSNLARRASSQEAAA